MRWFPNNGYFQRAERLFIEADLPQDAITMYLRNNKWADAYRVSWGRLR